MLKTGEADIAYLMVGDEATAVQADPRLRQAGEEVQRCHVGFLALPQAHLRLIAQVLSGRLTSARVCRTSPFSTGWIASLARWPVTCSHTSLASCSVIVVLPPILNTSPTRSD